MRISDWSSDVCSSDLPRSKFKPGRFIFVSSVGSVSDRPGVGAANFAGKGKTYLYYVYVNVNYKGFPCLMGKSSGINKNACRKNRSEEHTSELQSLMRISYAVFCLTKKNKQNNIIYSVHAA